MFSVLLERFLKFIDITTELKVKIYRKRTKISINLKLKICEMNNMRKISLREFS